MSKFDDISTLLPEGLTEDTVTEIATLVSDVISEEVENKVKDLENKVHGFLRMKMPFRNLSKKMQHLKMHVSLNPLKP